ncbi:RimJ/RimL family protein N-acetyltransferase [Actinoplanes lutulentus]|uniref:RimJ/RimL family protein N-acetyltransferase n=1 Tax=Actinoplanes lutulentus TaxID=1287878 RepID=A0A327ZQY9_9ACTN|nr:GNAT family N-acetyltransferase [Actinoplanes lutulentus]MBB2941109.1 RimJ/RimL family protein N-acetyltransferase [Actinoplanes lutulentus]RAK43418.1 RimJ/RimL family protein N-acetyltransferase [Actinoplanes lutulentus]
MTTPAGTARLTFAEMTESDLDDLAALLGDPEVMRYYPRPKTRYEAENWITWNQDLYQRAGFGLWVIRSRETGEFLGDCGLTPQQVDGVTETEIGYHVRADKQRLGYATEAATACRDHARQVLGVNRLIAIIDPANEPSQRVAEKIGLRHERDTVYGVTRQPVRIYTENSSTPTTRSNASRSRVSSSAGVSTSNC